MYYDAKGYKPNIAQSAAKEGGTGLGEYEGSLLHVGTIDTVCPSALYDARLTRRALSFIQITPPRLSPTVRAMQCTGLVR